MDFLENFANTRILVVGDVMLDRYWWGSVKRISPEAPVPVVELTNCTYSGGGAANVATNVAGLGAKSVLLGVVGSDNEASLLRNHLVSAGVVADYLQSVPGRPTTVKTRVVAHHQHVARVDHEVNQPLDSESEKAVLSKLSTLIDEADTVIVSDYAKGLLTTGFLAELMTLAAGANKNVLVDPKGKSYARYRGATMITPNRIEAAEACNLDPHSTDIIERAGGQLMRELEVAAVLITQGEAGMTLFRRDQQPKHFETEARNVYDVTGAGDTVIATLATAIGAGADLETATRLANTAAGIVVEQVGTSSISLEQLRHAIEGQ